MKKIMKKVTILLMVMVMLTTSLGMNVRIVKADDDDWELLTTIDDPTTFYFHGFKFSYTDDSVLVNIDVDYDTFSQPYFCMYAYDYTTSQWSLVGGWQTGTEFEWKPDANDNYALVAYAGDRRSDMYKNSKGELKEENVEYVIRDSYWQEVNRPQMGKHVTGDCAMPTVDGLLFGCTSNVTNADTDYYTTCYIYSYTSGSWIAQAPYQASGSAWFRIATLSKGTYIMYTCTEKMESNGQRRKLSCSYYVFSV